MNERILKYFTGQLTQSQRIELLKDVETDETLKQEFATYRNLRGLVSLKHHAGDDTEGKAHYKPFMRSRKASHQKRFTRFFRYAAAIILLIAGTWTAAYFTFNHQEPSYNTLNIPAGQYASLTLSDGTEVWMNARSSIRYPSEFGRNKRTVEVNGEAYFQVARNEKAPFVVSTATMNVEVLGTTFNVKSYQGDNVTEVSLLEGSVVVHPVGDPTKEVRLKPMQALSMTDNKIRVTQLHDENDFLWKQGILFFDNLPLADIARKIEWHYDTRIIIENPNIGKFPYTGKFRQQDGPHEILRILQKSYKFTFEKDDVNNIFILR